MNQPFCFIEKFDFAGNIDFFRFLGFFEKNLKPKNRFLGGKIEKIKKSKDVFGKEMESFREESGLILTKN